MIEVIPEPSALVVEMKEPIVTQTVETKTEPLQPSAETEELAATQEPIGSPENVQEQTEELAVTQEPVGSPETV